MSRRILILGLAIGCLGIGFAGGFLIRGNQKPISGGSKTPSPEGVIRVRVPNIVGLEFQTALRKVHAAGLGFAQVNAFRMKDRPRGIVVAQAPTPGALMAKGAAVVLDVSAGDSLKPIGVASCELFPTTPACRGGIAIIHVIG